MKELLIDLYEIFKLTLNCVCDRICLSLCSKICEFIR